MPIHTLASPQLPLLPPPTEEQSFILGLTATSEANLIISSVAGSGKTTMLEMLQAEQSTPVLCLAFNTRIAERMRETFCSTTTVKTLNALGHSVWAKACSGSIVLNQRKSRDVLLDTIKALPKGMQGEAYEQFSEIVSAVGLAKSLGYIPERYFPNARRLISRQQFLALCEEELSDLSIDLVDEVLVQSIKLSYAGSIDFNDQIYMPALFGGTFPRHPLVLVDEAQDLSPVNHEMLHHLRRSRIIAVGDPFQSIYRFRGAAQGGMAKLKARFKMVEAPLSVSFRCPRAIVENVRWRVPHMKWVKEGGQVGKIDNFTAENIVDDSVIICRNNAPLFALALRLLRSGRSVNVSGSDLGPRVIGIMRRLGEDHMSQANLFSAIESWREDKLARESKVANDLADCMQVFAQQGSTLSQAVAYAESLFQQSGAITLTTGHKAKGLEWETVYHLDPWLLGEDEQDANLRYVIQTRSLDRYFEIELNRMKWR